MAEFKFSCPNCRQNIQLDVQYSGAQINCPSCKQLIVVPPPSTAAPPAAAVPVAKKSKILSMILIGAAVLFVLAAGPFLFFKSSGQSGLVGKWSAEGDGRNSIGNDNAQLVNVSFAKGKVGRAFDFNGENSQIKIPSSREFRTGLTNGFTLEAWIKPSDVSKRNPIFEWNTGDGNTYWGVHFYIDPFTSSGQQPGALYANIVPKSGGWHQMWSAGGVVANNEFQFVALTYDRKSGEAKLYSNGEVVAEQDIGHFIPQTGYSLYIGKRPMTRGETYTFEGMIDEPAIYNRALSENEILAQYKRSK